MKPLTKREALLIELVWILSYGTKTEMGYSLAEVMDFLTSRIRRKEMKTSLEVLEKEGHDFLKEVKGHLIEESLLIPNRKAHEAPINHQDT